MTLRVRLVECGSFDLQAGQLGQDPIWVGGGRLVLTTALDTLTVVRLADGLPVENRLQLPGEMSLPTAPWDNYDLNFDRVGVHAAALRPDGGAFAIGGVTEDSERALFVFDLDGSVTAEATVLDASAFEVPEDFELCPIALAWGPAGDTLFLCCSIENEHHVACLTPALEVVGLVNLGGEFPEPASVFPFAHPKTNAAAFYISCGQDGQWLKLVERTASGLVEVPQALADDASALHLFGFAPDGATFYTASFTDHDGDEAEELGALHARPWPSLAVDGQGLLGGHAAGGAVLGDDLAVVIASAGKSYAARWPRPDDELHLYRRTDRTLRARGPFPEGHFLVGADAGLLITRANERVTVWRPEVE